MLGKIFDFSTFAVNLHNSMGEDIKSTTDNQAETEQTQGFSDINTDSDIPGNTHLSNPEEEIQNAISKLQSELNEQKDKYLRLVAEFDNFKRRTAKERIELIQTAGKDILVSLLDVMDDCDR